MPSREPPQPLKRAVLVEAGHRCAIPTCRQVPVEIHHIDPWADVQEHRFENLLALCPTCHARCTAGTIDRVAQRQYKANLGLISSRYGDLERRVLKIFALDGAPDKIMLSKDLRILVMYLIQDGIIERIADNPTGLISVSHDDYRLTTVGAEFIRKLVAAEALE